MMLASCAQAAEARQSVKTKTETRRTYRPRELVSMTRASCENGDGPLMTQRDESCSGRNLLKRLAFQILGFSVDCREIVSGRRNSSSENPRVAGSHAAPVRRCTETPSGGPDMQIPRSAP